jgi:hypothetical protein
MTNEQVLLKDFQSLSDNFKQEVLDFVEFLKQKQTVQNAPPKPRKKRKAGSAKGMFVMTDAFDEPLEDFAEYM